MKKVKWILLLLVSLLVFSLSGCEKKPSADIQEDISAEEGLRVQNIPQIGKVKSICELATVECRYHNVAKSTKEAGTGVLHWGEKERTFWIEYTGIAEIGFQTKDIEMR